MKTVKFQTINASLTKGKKKVLSPEVKSKRRQLKTKFNIDKDQLNEEDLIKIMSSIDIESQNHDLNERSKKLLNKLDKDNLGYVETDDFVEEIINRNEKTIEDEFTLFYKKINENLFLFYLNLPYENILLKNPLLHFFLICALFHINYHLILNLLLLLLIL